MEETNREIIKRLVALEADLWEKLTKEGKENFRSATAQLNFILFQRYNKPKKEEV